MIFRLLLLIAAYLLGSIPFGYLIVRNRLDEDIRHSGSGGTGTTNVMRKAGKTAAAMTFFLDAAKGSIAVLLMKVIAGDDWRWIGAAAILAIIGHNYPVWLRFHGGKGVATGMGVFLILSPLSMLSAIPIFAVVVYAKRYVSLASIIASASVPIWLWLYESVIWHRPIETVVAMEITTVICCTFVITSHHQNIKRLLDGTENKISTASGSERGL